MTARAFGIGAVLVIATGTATAAVTRSRHDALPSSAQEREHPGPDSARVSLLLSSLGSGDALVCELIADQIGNFWSSGDEDGLGRFADTPRLAATALAKDSLHGRASAPGAIRLLTSSLRAENACVRRVAAKLLGRSRIETTQLAQLLGDPSSRTREAAAYAIGVGNHRGDRGGARVPLETMLRDRGAPEAAMAAWALGEIEDSASVPALERAVGAGDPRVRLAAVDALGNIKDTRAISTLERALASDASAPVRARAAHAIGDIGEHTSITAIAAAIDDPSPVVRYAAVEALTDVHDLHLAPAPLIKAAQSGDARLRRLAALALAEIHDPATLETLVGFLGSDDRDVRRKAAEALGEIRSSKASSGLMRLLKDSDAEVRKAAVEALGEINRER